MERFQLNDVLFNLYITCGGRTGISIILLNGNEFFLCIIMHIAILCVRPA